MLLRRLFFFALLWLDRSFLHVSFYTIRNWDTITRQNSESLRVSFNEINLAIFDVTIRYFFPSFFSFFFFFFLIRNTLHLGVFTVYIGLRKTSSLCHLFYFFGLLPWHWNGCCLKGNWNGVAFKDKINEITGGKCRNYCAYNDVSEESDVHRSASCFDASTVWIFKDPFQNLDDKYLILVIIIVFFLWPCRLKPPRYQFSRCSKIIPMLD